MNGKDPDTTPTPERPGDTSDPERGPLDEKPGRARETVGERLEEAAGRVRTLGDRAADRNRLLAPTRPLAYDTARGIDNAAAYLRTRELDEMRADLEAQVRRHPIAAVAVAFLAGYTLRRIFW